MLFRSKNIISKAQRTVARSKYDHVALLIKDAGLLGFLESTRIVGVNILLWVEFIERDWHSSYSKIIFRKLHVSNSEGFEAIIKDFAMESRGKKFNASIRKILGSKQTDENEGYFCSELLASAYKKAGILPSEIDPSDYWPGHFAEERNLHLVNAYLGPLTQINFEI